MGPRNQESSTAEDGHHLHQPAPLRRTLASRHSGKLATTEGQILGLQPEVAQEALE